MSVAKKSKELCTLEPTADLVECDSCDARIARAGAMDAVISGKGEAPRPGLWWHRLLMVHDSTEILLIQFLIFFLDDIE